MPKTKGFGKSIWEGNDWITQCVTKSVRALENSFSSELNWYCSMIHHLTWYWTPSVAKVKCREEICVLVNWLELSRWPTDTGCCHKTGPHGRRDRRHRHLMRKGHTRQIRNHRCHKQVQFDNSFRDQGGPCPLWPFGSMKTVAFWTTNTLSRFA